MSVQQEWQNVNNSYEIARVFPYRPVKSYATTHFQALHPMFLIYNMLTLRATPQADTGHARLRRQRCTESNFDLFAPEEHNKDAFQSG